MEFLYDTGRWLILENMVSNKFWQSLAWFAPRCGDKQAGSGACAASALTRAGLGSRAIIAVRVAGVSGALAVALGAYGAHKVQPSADPELYQIYEKANRYHILHSLALLATPVSRYPTLTTLLFVTSTAMFCGSAYCYVLSQRRTSRALMPYGGMLLIAGWLSFTL